MAFGGRNLVNGDYHDVYVENVIEVINDGERVEESIGRGWDVVYASVERHITGVAGEVDFRGRPGA